MSHPMLPGASHDEMAEQLFVRDLKGFVAGAAEEGQRAAAAALDPGEGHNARAEEIFDRLHGLASFRNWAALRRESQELLWDVVGASVRRQAAELEARAAAAPAIGSVTVDPDFVIPSHLADHDVHLMPGGYVGDDGGVAQGALMDRGGAVYMLGRNGGLMNDRRGHTAAAHLFHRFPDFAPKRLLELGCGIGASLVPLAGYFPGAEAHGIDVGAAQLRYAHARAAHLGAAVHLRLGDALAAPFPDESFDLVFSCVTIHELQPGTIGAMMDECHRLLRPGGVVLHLEVPQRYAEMDLWGQVRGEIEARYNNEPNWKAATSADYVALLGQAGFRDIAVGYQDATDAAARGNAGFGATSKGVFRSWAVMSAIR
ncbi:class I SAM-dependent methyltransferase [Sphingopyxis panaciterrulae]|uniref:Ubiquinone/menaquinone biosynthesis C-methylase UbiE n=1 Tax=Sphingopyxis panaciterrulae TaxID=462372 RepID=A0A7W9ESD6_9SPHN|nr:class I SAM-dependent methyltransferase [Sphingopyxis panaciterrulae]MBB5708643.1 ubiquinone/menaquinone biosynthesis C-methylase UbiE [Sphingopyxis panaciterrulae]